MLGRKNKQAIKAQKPEKVYEKLLLMSTKKDDLTYDPMAGSGTTGAVCKTLSRKSILSDMSEDYVQIIEQRLGIQRVPLEIIENLKEKVA